MRHNSRSTVPRENGQVLIIILLVMIVGLTTGLFLLGRTTTDVSLSTKIEESTRAFNAAEAGIEEAIRSGTLGGSPVPFASGVTYQVNLGSLTPGSDTLYPDVKHKPTAVGDVFTVWLVPHDDVSGELDETEANAYKQPIMDVCFSSNTPLPALGITVFFRDAGGEYRSSFVGFDPDDTRNINGAGGGNKLKDTAAVGTCGGAAGYDFRAQLNLQTDFVADLTAGGVIPLALRIRPYYAASSIAVIPQAVGLPKQGNQIESTGRSGETTRKIEVDERYTVPAPFLDHALYSAGNADLTK